MRLLLPSVLAFAVACEPDPVVETEVLPYEGEPYPDQTPAIPYAGPVGVVTDSYSDTVSVVDLTTGTLLAQRPVGRNPVDLDGPHHIVVDKAGEFAYIGLSYPLTTATGPHAEHGSALLAGYIQKLRLSDLSIVGQVRVDASPGDLVLSDDGKRIVTSHFDLLRATKNPTDIDKARATIAVADPSEILPTSSKPSRFIPVCVAPHGMAMTQPTGSPLYVTCYGEDKVAIVDLDTEEVEYADVGAGATGFGSPIYGPYAALLMPDENVLVLSNTASKDIRFFDTETRTIDGDRTLTLFGAPFFSEVSHDGTELLVPTQQPDAIVRYDLAAGTTETRSFTGGECVLPHQVARIPGGYAVVCEGDRKTPGNVLLLDEALEVRANVPVGLYPDAISVVSEVAP